MLEGLYPSSASEHPSQPEANVLIALTSTVIALLLSRRTTRADHKNIHSPTEEVERWHSEKGNDCVRLGRGGVYVRKTHAIEMGSGLAHTLPLRLQLPKLQRGPGIRHMIQQAGGRRAVASAGR